MNKVYSTKEDDSDWKSVPFEMKNEFVSYLDGVFDDSIEWEDKNEQYMLGIYLNNVQLYAEF